MKNLKTFFMLFLLATVCFVTVPTGRGGDNTTYSMQFTEVSASTGEFLGTSDLNLLTESQLKALAASESSTSVTVLIGTGSATPNDPVTDIQIVGIAGEAYGNITQCPPPEE